METLEPMKEGCTREEVVEWMVDALTSFGLLERNGVLTALLVSENQHFIATNGWGGQAIDPKILSRFRKLMKGKMKWDAGDKTWWLLRDGVPGWMQEKDQKETSLERSVLGPGNRGRFRA